MSASLPHVSPPPFLQRPVRGTLDGALGARRVLPELLADPLADPQSDAQRRHGPNDVWDE